MLTIKDIELLEKDTDNSDGAYLRQDIAHDLLVLAKRSLLFDGILGSLKQVLESVCHSYGNEEKGNRCCFRFNMGQANPCITCNTRRGLGYPCPACKKSH